MVRDSHEVEDQRGFNLDLHGKVDFRRGADGISGGASMSMTGQAQRSELAAHPVYEALSMLLEPLQGGKADRVVGSVA
jgi:hypothetical protein